MDFDINCINIELNNIVKNNKRHNNITILYALAAIEFINIMRKTHNVVYDFIKIMEHLKEQMNCYIDFNFLKYVFEHKKKIIFCDNDITILSDNFNSFDSFDSFDSLDENKLSDRIKNMLKDDAFLLNTIIDKNTFDFTYDEYGKIDKSVIKLSKKLFDILDKDKDGYINALDVLHIIKMYEKYILLFEYNFIDEILQMLVMNGKLDFNLFYTIYHNS